VRTKRQLAAFLVMSGLLVLVADGDLRARQTYGDLKTVTPIARGEWLVIGFPGGRQRWDNSEQIVVRIAEHLRMRRLPAVHIEVIENKHRSLAVDLIRAALDANTNGTLEVEELSEARVILFGQSLGGAAVVDVARDLDELGVPVRLTVQIDSVGIGDALIPANVRRAANLYQPNGLLIRGEEEIRAQDSARTEILGNFRYDYSDREIELPASASIKWYRRLLWPTHTGMEFDPEVWRKAEELLLDDIDGRHFGQTAVVGPSPRSGPSATR
jgi:hypothetical protein